MTYISNLLTALFFCLLLSSCATMQPATDEQILSEETDLSCAYFYFLWGSHAEFGEQYAEALEAYEKALICDQEAEYVKEKIPVLLLKMGEFEKAAAWLVQAIDEHPDNNTYRLLLASLDIQQEKIEEAILLYQEVLRRDPDNDGVKLRLALLYNHLERFQAAEEIFVDLLQHDGDAYFVHLSYARLLKRMEKFQDTAREYERALSLNWSKDLAFEIGYFYVDQQMYEDALRIYTAITADDPLDEQAALSRVQALLDMDQDDMALNALYTTRKNSKDPANIDIIISKVLLRKGAPVEAKIILTRLVNETDNQEARYMLALLAFQENDYETSLRLLPGIHKESEEYEEVIFLQTRIYQKQGRIDEAIQLLKKHTATNTDQNPLFYALLSSLYQERGDNALAMTLLEEANKSYPDNNQLLFEYGLVLEKNGRYEQAIKVMQRVLELEPDHAEALNYIGYTWADKNMNLVKALEYILRANTLKPDNGFIIDSLGWAYYRLGDYQKAVRELERSLKLIPDDPHIYDHLGDVYRSLQRFKEAKKVYEKALEMFKDDKEKAVIQRKIDELGNI